MERSADGFLKPLILLALPSGIERSLHRERIGIASIGVHGGFNWFNKRNETGHFRQPLSIDVHPHILDICKTRHGGENMSYLCADCSVDTTPCTGKRGCRHAGRWEHYMVHNAIWQTAGMLKGFLCIGCLESRLGRTLSLPDFTAAPINNPSPWDTPRLRDRKA